MLPLNTKFILFLLILLFLVPIAYAHCPLCTAAVGAAAVTAKYYGVDTSIIGLLIGAFAVSTGLWIGLKLKNYFKYQLHAVTLFSFLATAIPVVYGVSSDTIYLPVLWYGEPGSALNQVYWLNKLLLGSIIGAVVTLLGYKLHKKIKITRGKVLFPYQGIAITLGFLLISGLGLYFLLG